MRIIFILIPLFIAGACMSQTNFLTDCFVGGVTTGGFATQSASSGYCKIQWQDDYIVRQVYAITYRYGRPDPYKFLINGDSLEWNASNQAGPEMEHPNTETDFFAVHAEDITDKISISSDSVYFEMTQVTAYPGGANWGWWGVYLVVLYESPTIITPVCVRIYTADQTDPYPQLYDIETPLYLPDNDVGLSVYFDRLTNYYSDASVLTLNGDTLGIVWGVDDYFPTYSSGIHGYFYYHNGTLTGIGNDTANTRMYRTDGIAVVNDYLIAANQQELKATRISNGPTNEDNPFPAFVLTYTPECEVADYELQRYYAFCPGDTVQFAASGFDSYSWSPAAGLSDTTIANPLCFADSSRWYYVTMKAEGGCSITQPVKARVHPAPAPAEVRSTDNVCPEPNGALRLVDPAGLAPFTYELDGRTQSENLFDSLLYGFYPYTITDARGCTFSDTAEVKLKTEIFAGFEPTPRSGDTPLEVFFQNQSHNAQNFLWQWEGQTFSTAGNPLYTFTDTGTFVITQIAYNGEPWCSDTATAVIRTLPGINAVVPNVFTPNGDGENDQLVARLFGVQKAGWQIYNRWGQELHHGSADPAALYQPLWNGQSPSGQPVSDGVYTVVLQLHGAEGRYTTLTVMVSVKR